MEVLPTAPWITRRVTCKVGQPHHLFHLPLTVPNMLLSPPPVSCLLTAKFSWVMTGRLALKWPPSPSSSLACVSSRWAPPPPASPCHTRRTGRGPPLTPVRAVTHSAADTVLTSSRLKYPPRPAALPCRPPPYPAIITLSYMLIWPLSLKLYA